MSVRDVRAHLAEVITRAQNGSPTVITRNGEAVAAVVPIEDFNVLEDAIDRYFSREADRDLAENPDAPTYSMSEVVAACAGSSPNGSRGGPGSFGIRKGEGLSLQVPAGRCGPSPDSGPFRSGPGTATIMSRY